jgi:hypothetical protein
MIKVLMNEAENPDSENKIIEIRDIRNFRKATLA